jgi:hypothetical protein
MRRTLTAVGRFSAAGLFMAIGLSAYGCADTGSINEEAQLASLTVTPGTLDPSFSSDATNYTVTVSTTDTSVTITATPRDSDTTMTINGTATGAGQGRTITLGSPGSTIAIPIVLTAPSGTQNTYIVSVERPVPPVPLSSNNNLSALSVTGGPLVPAFAQSTLNYTVGVSNNLDSVTVSATKADLNAVMSGDVGAPAGTATGSASISLDVPGTSKNVSITVTAPNGASKTYTIVVTRLLPGSNNNLSSLTVRPGSLSPGFSQDIQNYEVSSSAGILAVSATKADPDAVMSGSVAAGTGVATGSATIPLGGPGVTTRISITVTAQNGASRTYTISVSRPFR